MLPPSDDEDGELTVVNANRRHIATYEEESEEDSSESEEERWFSGQKLWFKSDEWFQFLCFIAQIWEWLQNWWKIKFIWYQKPLTALVAHNTLTLKLKGNLLEANSAFSEFRICPEIGGPGHNAHISPADTPVGRTSSQSAGWWSLGSLSWGLRGGWAGVWGRGSRNYSEYWCWTGHCDIEGSCLTETGCE